MKKTKFLILFLALLLVLYLVVSPYLTVYLMKEAAQRGDTDAFVEYIDFPSVRQGFKEQLNTAFAAEIAKDKRLNGSPLAILGTTLASVIIEKMVDSYLTPSGVAQMMGDEKNRHQGTNATDSDGVDPQDERVITTAYKSWSRFTVESKDATGKVVVFVFRRQGIDWKLTNVVVPLP